MSAGASRGSVPAPVPEPGRSGLLHPLALLALAALVVNDHLLKPAWPGWITGKASDAAGMVFFPLLLRACVEGAARLAGRRVVRRDRLLFACVGLTVLAFAAVKTLAPATALFAYALGLLQWPFRAAGALLRGAPPGRPMPVEVLTDPTDLAAIPFAGIALLVALQGEVRLDERATAPSSRR